MSTQKLIDICMNMFHTVDMNDLIFSEHGNRIYVNGPLGVNEYSLDTAWDISSASPTGGDIKIKILKSRCNPPEPKHFDDDLFVI